MSKDPEQEFAEKVMSTMKVVSNDEAEQCDAVVGAKVEDVRRMAKLIGRDLTGHGEVPCCKCGTILLISPQSPKTPPRICQECAMLNPADENCTTEASMKVVRGAMN